MIRLLVCLALCVGSLSVLSHYGEHNCTNASSAWPWGCGSFWGLIAWILIAAVFTLYELERFLLKLHCFQKKESDNPQPG